MNYTDQNKTTHEEEITGQKIVLLLANMHLCLQLMDDLKETRLYSQKVKNLMNTLEQNLETRVDKFFLENADEAVFQLEDVALMCKKMLVAMLNIDKVHHTSFTNTFKTQLQRHHLPEALINQVFEEETTL